MCLSACSAVTQHLVTEVQPLLVVVVQAVSPLILLVGARNARHVEFSADLGNKLGHLLRSLLAISCALTFAAVV